MTQKQIKLWENYIKSLRAWLTKQKKAKVKKDAISGPGDHPPPPPPHP